MATLRSRLGAASAVTLALLAGCGETSTSKTSDSAGTHDSDSDVAADGSDDGSGDSGADGGSQGDPTAQAALLAVPEAAAYEVAGLGGEVQIVETAHGVPHIYAANEADLAFGHGFIVGRDRWFVVDMGRRLGQGKVSGLLGDAALSSDIEARQNGLAFVATQILAALTPQQQVSFDAFAAGLNAYRDAVLAGELPPPSELKLAAPLLGKKSATELMQPFSRADVAAFAAVIVYQLGYETGDVGRGKTARTLETMFKGVANEELRRKGAIGDIWNRLAPLKKVSSSTGFGLETAAGPPPPPPEPGAEPGPNLRVARSPAVHAPMLDRLDARLTAFEHRLGRDEDTGWGSNAWAVAAEGTADGRALLAGDGHLPLTIPSLFYQIGLDSQVFGGGGTHQAGLVIPGLPLLAVGTNGDVAWCQTQLMGDITDWYVEQITLGADGLPTSSLFQGKQQPLVAVEEVIDVATIQSPLFPSKGGKVAFTRYMTFDGRWITELEGTPVGKSDKPKPSAKAVLVGNQWIEPGDVDKDGLITAISFDYTGLDKGNLFLAVDGFGHAADVGAYREATRHLVAYSQNLAVADRNGEILYSGYQAVPCRSQLQKTAAGDWADGSDPNGLLDGTKYGAFEIPIGADGKVDEAAGKADPSKCVVPFDGYPAARSPKRGYVLTANNDLGGASLDDSLSNDLWYIGGPWDVGFRAGRIDERLSALVQTKKASMATMAELQADHASPLGLQFGPALRKAVGRAKALLTKTGRTADEDRVVALYQSMTPTIDDVDDRLGGWLEGGCRAASGVKTFYHPTVDSAELADAVATTLFNRWWPRVLALVFDDEPMPGIWRFSGSSARARAIDALLNGRGANNPGKLASWNPDTEESIFFDVVGTEVVERSDEILLMALADALAFLSGPTKAPGKGGFGSTDMSTWLWGLRHQVRFESTIADFFSGDGLSSITSQFAIETDKMPLLTGDPKAPGKFDKGDPRQGLSWFPRPGDAFVIDAAGGTWGGDDATYGSGPVFRMVIALGKDGPEIQNIVPGGQSGLNDSAFFADQAAFWLANKTIPMPFAPADVAKAAVRRVRLAPAVR